MYINAKMTPFETTPGIGGGWERLVEVVNSLCDILDIL
jgi:hypothetical protein